MLIRTGTDTGWRVWFQTYAPVIFWVGVIFFLSSGFGASDETSRFVRPFLRFIFPNAPEADIAVYHYYVRKAAHFTEYAILAALTVRALFGRRPPRKFWPAIAVGLAIVIACCDEFYQSFNAARTPALHDVLLDTAGAIFAVLLIAVVNYKANIRILYE